MKLELTVWAGRLPLFRQELHRSLRGFGGWVLGNAAALLVYLPFFPSIRSSTDTVDYAALFPPELSRVFGLDQLATGAGYTQATYFGLIALLLYAIAAVGWGAGAIAGDEESGALELTLAHAVTRTQVVLERALAILLRGVVLAATGVAVIWALAGASQLDLTFTRVLAASASLVALTLVIGMAALCAGALTGKRSAATTVGASVAVVAYVLDATARATGIEWLGRVSPVTWAFGSDPITTGFAWAGLANLTGVALALLVSGLIGFRRRDVERS